MEANTTFAVNKRSWRACFAVVALLLSFPACAQWEAAIGPGFRHFDMKEYDRDGSRLVREKGWLPGIEARAAHSNRHWTWFNEAQYYKESISYDGQTQGGNPFGTSTDTALFYLRTGIRYALNGAVGMVAALEREKWKRGIRGKGSVDGLSERSDSYRLLIGADAGWNAAGIGRFCTSGSLVFSKAEKLRVSAPESFDDVSTETKSAKGFRIGLSLRPEIAPALELRSEFDYMKVGRSDLFARTRNGLPYPSAVQPEHKKQGITLSLRYHY